MVDQLLQAQSRKAGGGKEDDPVRLRLPTQRVQMRW